MKKLFKIVADLNDDLGVDYNAVVDVPAHLKGYDAFSKEQKDYFVQDEEKRIVAGVMISADTEIERYNKTDGKHYVFFPSETVSVLREKFIKKGYQNNLNEMHQMSKIISPEDALMLDTYIIDSRISQYPKCPPSFESQRLKDGTWIANYKIYSDELWQKIKDGTFNGFSVEGYFEKVEVKQLKTKMKNKNRFLSLLGFNDEEEKTSFVSATTADGTVVNYEGELAEGTLVTLEDGTPASEGEHQLTLEDATVVVINLDAEGVITSVEAVEEEMTAEIAEAMKAMSKATVEAVTEIMEAKFTALEKSFNDKFTALEKGEKFAHTGRKVETEVKKMTASELLRKNK